MTKKSMVHLRVYKGEKMIYDASRKSLNENQIVKIQHGSFEWSNFMKMAAKNGYCEIEVEKVINVVGIGSDEKIEDVSEISHIVAEVKNAVSIQKEVALTDDQKRIKELEDKLNSLIEGGSKTKNKVKEGKLSVADDVKKLEVKESTDANDYPKDPVELREFYEKLMEKKPHHKASDEKLIEQMNEYKAKQ